jgi:DNA-binding NtrC family response regulator
MNIDIALISNHYGKRITYGAALMGYGYEVAEMSTFEDMQTLLDAGVLPRTLIIDLKLSVERAGEFIEALRRDLRYEALKIIVMGGGAGEAQMMSEAGANLFLHRPVEVDDLLEAVHASMMQPAL